MTEIKLSKIIIDLPGSKVLSLPADEAKELYRELESLFGEKRTECIYADKD